MALTKTPICDFGKKADNFELKPKELIQMLDLKKPIYQNTAAYGHFGREDVDFSWEKTDKSSTINKI